LWNEASPARQTFYRHLGDFFAFRNEGSLVGFLVGNPIDWSSYYIRQVGVLPDFQHNKLCQTLVSSLAIYLRRHGVARIEIDIAPNNHKNIHIFNKLGFKIAGTLLTERWGAVVHLVKLLEDDNNRVFQQQFCHGDYA